jgi:hypothetical protein
MCIEEGIKGSRDCAYQGVSMISVLNQKKTMCGGVDAGETWRFAVPSVKFSVLLISRALEAGGSATGQATCWPWLMFLFSVTAYSSDNGVQSKRQDH